MEFLDLERWPEFKGYWILPGIASARFELRTPDILGSRIKVQNTDGSSHVEEIIEWDVEHKLAIKFHEFKPPLQYLATHFIETWNFDIAARGTDVSRAMSLYPRGILGWFMLLPVSRLMKRGFEKNASQLGGG